METLERSPVEERKGGRGNPNFGKKKTNTSENERDFGIEIDPAKTYTFETVVKSSSFRTQSLSGECEIFDPIEQRIRLIRYIPQAASIFKDEQDESFTDHHVEALYFSRDQLIIPGSDKRGVEYCLMHDRYDGTPSETRRSKKGAFFTLVDKEKYEKQMDERLSKELLALKLIEEAKIETLLSIARIICNVIETDELIVRNRLREFCKRPATNGQKSGATIIIESIKNPGLIRRYNVQLAIDKGIIKVDSATGSVTWGDSGNLIYEVNPSSKPVNQVSDIANFTFTAQAKDF